MIDKSAKIFIAGHKGMVGKSIYRCLSKYNYKNLLTIDKENLDLRESLETDFWFKKNQPEFVIVSAAKVGGIYANQNYPVDFLLDNLKIQNNVIESAWKNGTKKLLFLASSCIYPKFSKQPIKEEYLLKGELEQTSQYYVIAKIAGIKLCESLRKQYGFNALSLIPSNLYGPGDNYHPENSHVIASLIRKFYEAQINNDKSVTCWGTGNPKRDFLHVNDLAEACLFAMDKWDFKDKNFPMINNEYPSSYINVGSGADISIRDLAELISNIIGFKGEIIWDIKKPDGVQRKLLNIDKVKRLGWSPKISLEKGLEMTIKEYINSQKA